MSSFLPIDLLVDVTSTGVSDVFTVAKLPTLLIVENDPTLPNKEFVEVSSVSTAQSGYGVSSYVAGFAGVYFGVTSKKATKPERFTVYNWAESGQPEAIKGAKITASVFALNGDFKIDLAGTAENFTVDLTSALSYTEAASIIQAEIRTSTHAALETATVTYNATTGGFVLMLDNLIEYNMVITAGASNDIHNQLGLTIAEGATFIPLITAKTFAEALTAIGDANGNYYVITPSFQLTVNELTNTDQIADLGAFTHASNDRYMAVYKWDNNQLFVADSEVTVPYEGYNGLVIDSGLGDYSNAFLCGLVSAMNLKLIAGNYNLAWNDASIYSDVALTDASQYEAMKINKANAPAKFGILGQDDTIYMNGTILGSKTDSINVYQCNSFLKFALQIAMYNMQKSQALISLRGTNGFGVISSYLTEVFNSAVSANIIVPGATLTTTEKSTVIENFPDNADKALSDIQKFGYYYEVNSIDTVTKEMYITQAYMANMPIDKLIINSYILGA